MFAIDGNFSFSQDLLQKLTSFTKDFQLIATSYDIYDEIILKYPESIGILSALRKDTRVTIKHGIDSTISLAQQLKYDYDQDKRTCGILFNYIIFNFPHLGTEDYVAHSSMLAHTLCSAGQVMDCNSMFYITLAYQQAERWRLSEQAQRNGFTLVGKIPFDSNAWSVYMQKRHQTGLPNFHQILDVDNVLI